MVLTAHPGGGDRPTWSRTQRLVQGSGPHPGRSGEGDRDPWWHLTSRHMQVLSWDLNLHLSATGWPPPHRGTGRSHQGPGSICCSSPSPSPGGRCRASRCRGRPDATSLHLGLQSWVWGPVPGPPLSWTLLQSGQRGGRGQPLAAPEQPWSRCGHSSCSLHWHHGAWAWGKSWEVACRVQRGHGSSCLALGWNPGLEHAL